MITKSRPIRSLENQKLNKSALKTLKIPKDAKQKSSSRNTLCLLPVLSKQMQNRSNLSTAPYWIRKREQKLESKMLAKLGATCQKSSWLKSSKWTSKQSKWEIKSSQSASIKTMIVLSCPSTSRLVQLSMMVALVVEWTDSRKRIRESRSPSNSCWMIRPLVSPRESMKL